MKKKIRDYVALFIFSLVVTVGTSLLPDINFVQMLFGVVAGFIFSEVVEKYNLFPEIEKKDKR